MPSLWSEVQLTYVFIMTVFQGIFRAIDIGLHSRDLHTAQSAHSAVCQLHSTKAFGQFLADLPNYKKPIFIKHILRSNEN